VQETPFLVAHDHVRRSVAVQVGGGVGRLLPPAVAFQEVDATVAVEIAGVGQESKQR
jgi:spermidine synthase